jgi:hypothetical protein
VVLRDAAMKELVARHLRSDVDHPDAVLRAKVCAGMDRIQRRQQRRSAVVAVAAAAGVLVVVGVVWTRWAPRVADAVAHVQPTVVPPAAMAGSALAVAGKAQSPVRTAHAKANPRTARDKGKDKVALAAAADPGRDARGATGQGAAVVPQPLPGQLEIEVAAAAGHAAPQVAVQRVSARLGQLAVEGGAGEVLAGSLPGESLVEHSPFGAVRSGDSLRQMVHWHTANVPPEIGGSPQRVHRYLRARLSGEVTLPLAQGSGVELRGARIAALGGQVVAIYSYLADGAPITVISRAAGRGEDAEIEAPGQRRPSGVLLDRREGLQLVHVVDQDRVLTLVGDLSPTAMLQLLPNGGP